MNAVTQDFFGRSPPFLLQKYLGVELTGHKVNAYFTPFFAALGIELSLLHTLGKCSTT
jgi:hypothetical protein